MKTARNIAIVGLIALALTAAPGGGPALDIVLTVLTMAFFAAIGVFGYRLYREHRTFTLDAMDDRRRLIFYAAVGLAFLVFAATPRLFSFGGLGVLAWIALLGLASFAVFRVFASRY
ncbi:MAG: hypothetical protein ACR2KD_02325 [Thermoleophilaceae bacterium]|nr:hypothetical protein [Thermoleophilaceae bacterium]